MMNLMTKNELISFEDEIAEVFQDGKIHAPVHFSGGNEDSLIEIFKMIKEEDWVFSTHRSHYHALLKGVDREWLKKEILEGRSICLNCSEHHFFTSAIVGGVIPIGLGVALGIKIKDRCEHVWVFIGDMAAETGIFSEALKYARRQNLPITFIVEDNSFSVNTPTQASWGVNHMNGHMKRYLYTRQYPHQGTGKWVNF